MTTDLKGRIVYVDHCSASAGPEARALLNSFHPAFVDCVVNGTPLPEDIADLFTMEIVTVDGLARGILRFA